MPSLRIVLLLLALCVPCCAFAAQQSSSLSDLQQFSTIENAMPFGDSSEPGEIQSYLRSIQAKLAKTPVSERAETLKDVSDQTKWGTYQRFVAYYVCAWYGVNYNRTRDYLIHTAFWWEWGIGPQSQRPFSFDDVCIYMLYVLYEHNHDFKILHDILTTKSDAGTSQLIVCFTERAIAKHPRGVLHVAEMSEKGRDLAWKLLHLSPDDENHPLYILYYTEESLKTFRIYVTRVANDPEDPLCALAKGLLKKPAGGC